MELAGSVSHVVVQPGTTGMACVHGAQQLMHTRSPPQLRGLVRLRHDSTTCCLARSKSLQTTCGCDRLDSESVAAALLAPMMHRLDPQVGTYETFGEMEILETMRT